MITRLFFHLISGILGILIGIKYIKGVFFYGNLKEIIIAGILIGIVNFLLKPILNLVLLPLKILTFGTFGLLINLGLVWIVVGFIFKSSFRFEGLLPILIITLLVWMFNFILNFKK